MNLQRFTLQCILIHNSFSEIAMFFTRLYHLASFYEYISEFVHFLNQLIAIYGASVRASVFRGLFFILAGELESVESSPGKKTEFKVIKTADRFMMLEKNC